ncbi:hypothetical protein C8A00DRAFT_43389 [Chaetomidium leptoderma]|uniref:CENP-V/GFA domain-containing protein n=1 Tax=Chaetomidium leptoderma TaxID=669021 RepID=A0AAN6VLX1_9PEZI|nr:hypothetical protein C8A00DRAFT_43389 [Chaetomidium leptoderma]
MSFERPLRGSCHCGRNLYIIQFPKETTQTAQVLFNMHPSHRSTLATPLPCYLRVPLGWYHSTTVAAHADETRSQIRRVYTSPREQHAMRHFCGFCGTPLSYWSEQPRSEADFIHLTLGSLVPEDLGDLEDLGLLPASPSPSEAEGEEKGETRVDETGQEERDTNMGVGVLPWFDTLTEGSRLGVLRKAEGASVSRTGTGPGTVRVEEVVEWTGDGGAESPRKRKLGDVEGAAEVEDGGGVALGNIVPT